MTGPDQAEVEAVARALVPTGIGAWEELSDLQHSHYRQDAHIAIAALDAVRRSPQGEDHEAGIEAAAQAMTDWPDEWNEHDEGDKDVFRQMARDGVAAYLSRCLSPERDR